MNQQQQVVPSFLKARSLSHDSEFLPAFSGGRFRHKNLHRATLHVGRSIPLRSHVMECRKLPCYHIIRFQARIPEDECDRSNSGH